MRVNPIIILLSASLSASVAGASVTFRDGDFAPGTWGLEASTLSGGGDVSDSQVVTGGSPGAALRVMQSVNSPVNSTIIALHRFGTTFDTRYDPTTYGEIGTIDFSLDYRLIQGCCDGQAVMIAIKQAQVVYVASYWVTRASGVWQRMSVRGLTQDDFTRVDGIEGHPNFLATAAPMRFGFVTSNSTTGGGYTTIADYDNFSVTANPPCKADYNHDGGIDGSDVEAFFADWEQGNGAADVNIDGGVDGSDIEAFFTIWSAGGC